MKFFGTPMPLGWWILVVAWVVLAVLFVVNVTMRPWG